MGNKLFNWLLWIIGLAGIVLLLGFLYSLLKESLPALSHFGFFNFYSSSAWNSQEGNENYGALSFIVGSVLTAGLALIIALPFSLSLAVINEAHIKGHNLEKFTNALADFATTIPAVVWGIWGFYTIRPILNALHVGNQGYGIICAAIVLAIMIIPFAASYSTVYIKNIPGQLKENAYALGATGTEVIWKINLPYAGKGIVSAHLLALGKAFGETMIVSILIGNTNRMPTGLFDTGSTLTSILVDQAGTASDLKLSSLFAVALFLFVFSACINTLARYLIPKYQGSYIKIED